MGADAMAPEAAGGVEGARPAARRHLMKMEWADLLMVVVWVSLLLVPVVAFIWKIYRRGIWGAIASDPQLLQRVQREWKRRSDRHARR